jgi:uncharacterized protein YjbI with pentapeptide repeats
MANPDHLSMLKAGAEVWNQWRQTHPNQRPDLSNADLAHADLQDMNLSHANLSGANLTGANFAGTDLSYADLTQAQLQDALLKWTDSRGTLFEGATFTQDPALSLHLVTSLVARGAIAQPKTAD